MLNLYHDGALLLVERALSTDDIETLFSLIVLRSFGKASCFLCESCLVSSICVPRCGYKPMLEDLLGALSNIDRLNEFRCAHVIMVAISSFKMAARTQAQPAPRVHLDCVH